MAFDKWELDGQMDQNLWLSAQLDQEEVTPTGSQFKDNKEHCGGMLTAHGLEPPFMELWSSVLEMANPTLSLRQNVKRQLYLVITDSYIILNKHDQF